MPITVYGIKNCDTVRKARRWLDQQGLDHHYHDFRQDGLSADKIRHWIDRLGTDTLINKRSPSWRKVPEATRNALTDNSAVALLQEQPTLIKRPVLETDTDVSTGFREADWQTRLTD